MLNRRQHTTEDYAVYPLVNPDLFGRLQPEIDAACDEWINAGVRIPSREMTELMTRRVFDNVCRRFPDMVEFSREFDRSFPMIRGESINIYGVDVQIIGPFFGLLTFLLLAGFFFRRRRIRRIRRRI